LTINENLHYLIDLSEAVRTHIIQPHKSKQKHPSAVSGFRSVFRASVRLGKSFHIACAAFPVLAGAAKIQLSLRGKAGKVLYGVGGSRVVLAVLVFCFGGSALPAPLLRAGFRCGRCVFVTAGGL
jgi:hypothetical protein